jgi:phage repressor protein C with HTH and peptisase S24 domain
MSSPAPTTVAQRFKSIRLKLGFTQRDFATVLGVTAGALSQIEKGTTKPAFRILNKLATLISCDELCWLITGNEKNLSKSTDAAEVASYIRPVIRSVGTPIHELPPDSIADDYMAVPLLDGKVAAGAGGVVWQKVKSLVWVYRPELGQHKNLVAVKVAGDSMIPTIPPGAISIIDRDQWQATGSRKHIWAIRTDDGDTQIKRLHRINGGLLLLSDNFAEHPPTPAWSCDLKKLVIGKVVWMWRSL